jgi:AcrR family transcriptional regulator
MSGRAGGDRRGGWLDEQRSDLAAQQILDAAGRLFAQQGVAGTAMGDVARAAGCSRTTLYRYFDSRDALRMAYVHREGRRIGREVGEAVGGIDDPRPRLVEAVLEALRRVRGEPTLAAWFAVDDRGLTVELARRSPVIEAIAAGFLGAPTDEDVVRRARWLVRVIVSLLVMPGTDEDDERETLERFVAPVVVPGTAPRAPSDRSPQARS